MTHIRIPASSLRPILFFALALVLTVLTSSGTLATNANVNANAKPNIDANLGPSTQHTPPTQPSSPTPPLLTPFTPLVLEKDTGLVTFPALALAPREKNSWIRKVAHVFSCQRWAFCRRMFNLSVRGMVRVFLPFIQRDFVQAHKKAFKEMLSVSSPFSQASRASEDLPFFVLQPHLDLDDDIHTIDSSDPLPSSTSPSALTSLIKYVIFATLAADRLNPSAVSGMFWRTYMKTKAKIEKAVSSWTIDQVDYDAFIEDAKVTEEFIVRPILINTTITGIKQGLNRFLQLHSQEDIDIDRANGIDNMWRRKMGNESLYDASYSTLLRYIILQIEPYIVQIVAFLRARAMKLLDTLPFLQPSYFRAVPFIRDILIHLHLSIVQYIECSFYVFRLSLYYHMRQSAIKDWVRKIGVRSRGRAGVHLITGIRDSELRTLASHYSLKNCRVYNPDCLLMTPSEERIAANRAARLAKKLAKDADRKVWKDGLRKEAYAKKHPRRAARRKARLMKTKVTVESKDKGKGKSKDIPVPATNPDEAAQKF